MILGHYKILVLVGLIELNNTFYHEIINPLVHDFDGLFFYRNGGQDTKYERFY